MATLPSPSRDHVSKRVLGVRPVGLPTKRSLGRDYPRRGVVRVVRDVVAEPWHVLATVYAPGVAFNVLASLAHHGGISARSILYDLLLDRIVPFVARHRLALAPIAVAVVLDLYGMAWARRDKARERAIAKWYEQLTKLKDRPQPQTIPSTPVFSRLTPPKPFFGRAAQQKYLLERLSTMRRGSVAVLGMEGSGKRSLVHQVVEELRKAGRYKDGVLVLDSTALRPGESIHAPQRILAYFDAHGRRIVSEDPEHVQGIASRLFRGKDALVLLHDIDQATLRATVPMLTFAGANVIVTSCVAIENEIVPQSNQFDLDPLTEDEGVALFRSHLVRTRPITAPEMQAIRAIVRLFGAHPLAIKLAAAEAREQGRDLVRLAAELRNNPRLATDMREGMTPYKVTLTIEKSTAGLSSQAKELFTALGALGQTQFSRGAVEALEAGFHLDRARALRQLSARGLVTAVEGGDSFEQAGERLALEPIMWLYAAAGFSEWRERRDARYGEAFGLLADYYSTAGLETSGDALRLDQDTLRGVFAYLTRALARETRSKNRLQLSRRVVNLCHAGDVSVLLASGLNEQVQQLRLCVEAGETVASVARSSDERRVVATALTALGLAYERRHKPKEAEEAYQRAYYACVSIQAAPGKAALLVALGRTLLARALSFQQTAWGLAQFHEARERLERGIATAKATADRLVEAEGHCELCRIEIEDRRLEHASHHLDAALATIDSLRDSASEREARVVGATREVQAVLAEEHGALDEAESCYELALAAYEQARDDAATSRLYLMLGSFSMQHGNTRQAWEYVARSKVVAEGIGATALIAQAQRWLEILNSLRMSAVGQQNVTRLREVLFIDGDAAELAYEALRAHQRGTAESLAVAEQLYREALEHSALAHDLTAQAVLLYNLSHIAELSKYDRKDEQERVVETLKLHSLALRKQAEERGPDTRPRRALWRLSGSSPTDGPEAPSAAKALQVVG